MSFSQPTTVDDDTVLMLDITGPLSTSTSHMGRNEPARKSRTDSDAGASAVEEEEEEEEEEQEQEEEIVDAASLARLVVTPLPAVAVAVAQAGPSRVLSSLGITRYWHYVPQPGKPCLDLQQFQPRPCGNVAQFVAMNPLLPISLLKCDDPEIRAADRFFGKTYSYLGGVTFDKLQQLLHAMDERHHIFCSIVLEKLPCHLFFDFDLALNQPVSKHRPGEAKLAQLVAAGPPEQVVDEFVAVFRQFFLSVFYRQPDLSEMQWETACNPAKFSLHGHVITEAFADSEHLNRFMCAFKVFLEGRCREKGNSRLCVQEVTVEPDIADADEVEQLAASAEVFLHLIDFSIYSRNRNFRLVHCRKPGKAKLEHLPYAGSEPVYDEAPPSAAELLFRSMPSYSIAVSTERLLVYEAATTTKKYVKQVTKRANEFEPLVAGDELPLCARAIVERVLQSAHILGASTRVETCRPRQDVSGVTRTIHGECAPGTARCPILSRSGAPHIHRHTVEYFSITRHHIKVWDFKCNAGGQNKRVFPLMVTPTERDVLLGCREAQDDEEDDDDEKGDADAAAAAAGKCAEGDVEQTDAAHVQQDANADVTLDEPAHKTDEHLQLHPVKKSKAEKTKEKSQNKRRRRKWTAAETIALELLDQMVSCLDERRTKVAADRKRVIWCIRGSGGDEELAEKFFRRCPVEMLEQDESVDTHWSTFRAGRGWCKAKLLAMLKLDLGEDEYARRWQLWKPDDNAQVELHNQFDAGLPCNTEFVLNLLPLLRKSRFTDPCQLTEMVGILKQIGGQLSWLTWGPRMMWLAGDPSYHEDAVKAAWDAAQVDHKQRGQSWQKLRGFLASDVLSLSVEQDFYKDNLLFHSEAEALACTGNAGLSALFVAEHKNDVKINKKVITFYEQSKRLWVGYSVEDLSGLMTRALLPLVKQHRDRASFDKARTYSAAHSKVEDMVAPDPMLVCKLDKLRGAVDVLEALTKDGQIVRNILGSQQLRDEMFVGRLNRQIKLLPIKGGKVVELDTKVVRDRTRDDMFTTECPFDYIPASAQEECIEGEDPRPNVTKFIHKYWPTNADMHTYMQTTLGYAITGDTSERMAFFWIGKTGAGKTTLMKMVELVLGNVFFASIRPEVIMKIGAKRNPSAPTPELMCLVHARVASVAETEPGAKIEEDFFKRSVGNGDVMCVRGMFEGSVYFIPMFKPIVYSNDAPLFDANVVGVANKIQVVPFDIQFVIDESEKNREATKNVNQSENQAFVDEMKSKHLDEFGSWLVDGAYQYFKAKRDRLAKAWTLPKLVKDRTDQYQTVEVNPFEKFLQQRCRLGAAGMETVRAELQAGYKQWCADEDIKLSANQIKDACENRFKVERVRSEHATAVRPAGYYYQGVVLLDTNGEVKARPKVCNTASGTSKSFATGPMLVL